MLNLKYMEYGLDDISNNIDLISLFNLAKL